MQLNHLDDSIFTYINNNLPAGLGFQCLSVFVLAEKFGLSNYDETFVSLIHLEDGLEKTDIQDLFMEKVARLATELITSHKITLHETGDIRLDERIEICHFLELSQRLEDPTVLRQRIFDDHSTPRAIFVDVLGKLSFLQPWRSMEIIAEVHEDLIKAMRQLVEEQQQEEPDAPEFNYHQDLRIFGEFIQKTECLGMQLLSAGYTGLSWDVVVSLTPLDLHEHFSKLCQSDVPQCALDFLSLAMISRDMYQTPMLSLQKKMPEYLDNTEDITRVHEVLFRILNDFQSHKEAYLQALAVNPEMPNA